MQNENENFKIAEANLIEAIRQIPETEIRIFKVAFAAYQNEGGEFEDLQASAIAAIETLIFDSGIETETTTQDFEGALCELLCEIESGGAEIDSSVWEARRNFEKAARALFANLQIGENETGEIVTAVVKQFDIFEDIG